MESNKIRQKFIKYFKKNQHAIIDSSSLWPHDDPSVLLTTAGMQQLKPYFMGVKDPIKDFKSSKLASIQKCLRTSDIEEVGDATHHTFFEMLGNFSINDYFKEEAIKLAWDFLIKELKFNKNKLWATYFAGEKQFPTDTEAIKIWSKYLDKDKIVGFGASENWWGPAGDSGPCGPSSEIHYDFTEQPCNKNEKCLPNCECGRFMELWNLVFTEYEKNKNGTIKRLKTKNIDTGMGFERLVLILQNKKNIYETDLFINEIDIINQDRNFGSTNKLEDIVRSRIIADHIRSTIFLLADGIMFSNKEQGYILRKIFRRALDQYLHTNFNLIGLITNIIDKYDPYYSVLGKRKKTIFEQIEKEILIYNKTVNINIDEVVEKIKNLKTQTKELKKTGASIRKLTGHEAFILFTSYGLSPERIKRKGYIFDEEEFSLEIKKHQEMSRINTQKKFGGHGLNSTEISKKEKIIMTKYHTATHLLHQALREILGKHVKQQGSDINSERLRFDFEHPEKLTDQQKTDIENLVNQKINEKLKVSSEKMNYTDAIDSGALAFFKEKYPDKVTVYKIGDFSKELCGGPHVKNTGEIGKIKIVSEKSSSAGVRRIKAILV
ncbi:MAG: alanine--tRNA ligase [bacterium]|nr:alanine--tRNA ligase [bacterium]